MSQALVATVEAAEIARRRSLWERQLELVDDYEFARGLIRERLSGGQYDHEAMMDLHLNASGRGSAMRFELQVQQALMERERMDREAAIAAAPEEAQAQLAEVVRDVLAANLAADCRLALNGALGVSEEVACLVAEAMAPRLLEIIQARFQALAAEGE